MRKIMSVLLIMAMISGMITGCGNSSQKTAVTNTEQAATTVTEGQTTEGAAEDTTEEVKLEKVTMAVLFNTLGAQEAMMKDYLDNYIAPNFNCTFIYSEACDSAEKAITFVEQAYVSGAAAVLNFNTDSDVVIAKCNELGMYIVNNNNKATDDVKTLPYNLGLIGTSVASVAESYGEIVKGLVSDGDHNIIIVSGGAGIGNQQHKEVTIAILNVLQETYDLNYSDEIENIATVTAKTEVDTGSDIKILIYPGYAGKDTYVTEMSTILQSGVYDVLLSTYQVYTQFSVAVDEVEKAFGKNIKVASIAPLADATQKNFETLDSTGDTSLNAALVKPNSIIAIMFAMAYNGTTGHADFLKESSGEIVRYDCKMWVANSAEEYDQIAALDQNESNYSYTVEDLKQMIKVFSPELTQEEFSEWTYTSDAASVMERRGIK